MLRPFWSALSRLGSRGGSLGVSVGLGLGLTVGAWSLLAPLRRQTSVSGSCGSGGRHPCAPPDPEDRRKLAFAPPKGGRTRDVPPLPHHPASRLRDHLAEFPASEVTLPWVNPEIPTQGNSVGTAGTSASGRRPALRPASSRNQRSSGRSPAMGRSAPSGSTKRAASTGSTPSGTPSLRCTWTPGRTPWQSRSGWVTQIRASHSGSARHMMPEADGRGRAAMDAWFEADSDSFSPDSPQLPEAA